MLTRRKQGLLYLYKIDCKTKNIIKDKDGHNMTIKGSTDQEDLTVTSTYALNISTIKYKKQAMK